jgi:ATP-dependent RNA helicase DDX35
MEISEFRDFFINAEQTNVGMIAIPGQSFAVDIHYTEAPVEDYLAKSVETILKIHQEESPGDILVFLTGKDDIDVVSQMISDKVDETYSKNGDLRILPLHGGLHHEEQMKVFSSDKNSRSVILSTNIAEASVTIPGIAYVVDSGFVKLKYYNPVTSMESLIITPISQASADQRAGRAGRITNGKAYRLYTFDSFSSLSKQSIPEMQRSDLSTVILQLKSIGIENVLYFDFLSPPSAELMTRALELLYSLNALDDYGRLTIPFGMQIAEFPLDPLLSTCLLNSGKFACAEEMVTIAAMLSVQNIFMGSNKAAETEKNKFATEEGDHITYFNVYQGFIRSKKSSNWCNSHYLNYQSLVRAVSIRTQLLKHLQRLGIEIKSCGVDTSRLLKCLVTGCFPHAAQLLPDGGYISLRDRLPLFTHPNSVLYKRSPQYVVYHEVVETTKPYMRDVSVIEARWLTDLAPHYYKVVKPLKKAED